jgi:sarcosine oxidase subunit alpha
MKRLTKSGDLTHAVQRGQLLTISIDGNNIEAYEGETVATALLAAGITTFNLSHNQKKPRSLYCGMGVCYECLVTINGIHGQRACITPVEAGMVIETSREVKL